MAVGSQYSVTERKNRKNKEEKGIKGQTIVDGLANQQFMYHNSWYVCKVSGCCCSWNSRVETLGHACFPAAVR